MPDIQAVADKADSETAKGSQHYCKPFAYIREIRVRLVLSPHL
jgi:hypothetical protein